MHDLTSTNLKNIDSLANRYIKQWLSLPQSATLAVIHSQHGLNIKSITQIYEEAHALAYASSRMKADRTVNAALDSRLEREKNWTKKGLPPFCQIRFSTATLI